MMKYGYGNIMLAQSPNLNPTDNLEVSIQSGWI